MQIGFMSVRAQLRSVAGRVPLHSKNLRQPLAAFDMKTRTEPQYNMPYDILIVDDSTAIRKILQRVLHAAEVPMRNIYEAGDGVEALAILKANKVTLILSDINMPNMDGIQLLGQVRANVEWKDVPMIMITTEGSQAKVIEAVQLGANGYVRKPFTPEQIKTTIAELN
jgi:two-component system chemotaxis response regulator CheY